MRSFVCPTYVTFWSDDTVSHALSGYDRVAACTAEGDLVGTGRRGEARKLIRRARLEASLGMSGHCLPVLRSGVLGTCVWVIAATCTCCPPLPAASHHTAQPYGCGEVSPGREAGRLREQKFRPPSANSAAGRGSFCLADLAAPLRAGHVYEPQGIATIRSPWYVLSVLPSGGERRGCVVLCEGVTTDDIGYTAGCLGPATGGVAYDGRHVHLHVLHSVGAGHGTSPVCPLLLPCSLVLRRFRAARILTYAVTPWMVPGDNPKQPLLPADAYIQGFFPDRVWAIRLPALALVVGLTVIGVFVGLVMKKEADKKRQKQAHRIIE